MSPTRADGQSDAAARRRRERHRSALVRAIGANPAAELRGQRLTVADRPIEIASPHLSLGIDTITAAVDRGIADALGLRIRHSDHDLHAELRPAATVAGIIFDLLEQLRCESLTPPSMPGVAANLDAAFTSWCERARGEHLLEREAGVLLYTLIHLTRARLMGPRSTYRPDDEVDAITEATRFALSPVIGSALAEMARARTDQRRFAAAARFIADYIADELGGDGENDADTTRLRLLAITADTNPTEDGDAQYGPQGTGVVTVGGLDALDGAGDYHVYRAADDREITGADLYPPSARRRLRGDLDRLLAAQSVSPARLAQRLRALLAEPSPYGWSSAHEDGLLDPARLARLVTDPADRNVFRRPASRPSCDAVVSFLIDTSGSMKRQRFEAVAVLVDSFARALELAGARCEVLGFTTREFSGGEPRRRWEADGEPADPGRLTSTEHIVYSAAETPWRRDRLGLASMLRTDHYRESIDGEAVLWAFRRLLDRPERRRHLVVISDGAPNDAATSRTNRDGFLADHLHAVTSFVERRSDVRLAAIALDHDVGDFYRNWVPLDLSGTLSLATYEAALLAIAGPR